jgi:hypothetical protein
MRKLVAALAFFWLACVAPALADNTVGPTNQIICNKTVALTIASATTTSAIAGVAGQSIFICGWHVTTTQAATFPTFQFEYGTQGGPCTTPTAVTPAFGVTNTAPSADHVSIATIQTPAGTQFCVVSGATTTNLAIELYYSQF